MKKTIKLITSSIIILSLFICALTYLVPSPILTQANHIELYDLNENKIYEQLYNYESNYIPLNTLNSYVYNAFVAIEDQNFYKHKGFDLKRNIIHTRHKNRILQKYQ